jgi:RimJ/RimL family protein N-acetyltransferase
VSAEALEAPAGAMIAFARLGLGELISIVHPENQRSRRVTTKVGMTIERQIHNPVLGARC